MFARVTTVHLPEAGSSAEILKVHERLYARLKRMHGFRDYIALVNRNTGEAKAIILWESKADMAAHHKTTTALLSRIGVELNTTPQQVEEYEVAFHT
jgi:heme-degrading monooxygenase HmoA